MPNYRRYRLEGSTYFFTVVTERRAPIFRVEAARSLLGTVFREARDRWPFRVEAIVILPDHIHALWTLPNGDDRYPTRWGWIKKEFSRRWLALGGMEQPRSLGRINDRRRGIFQPKYWEHLVQDEVDFERHADYIHYNPVRHGLVRCAHDWPHSSFRRFVREGHYPEGWGCSCRGEGSPIRDFDRIAATAME